MRNPGNDFHRRQADAEATARSIRWGKQARRNAREWLRRGAAAMARGDLPMADALFDRAVDEMRRTTA